MINSSQRPESLFVHAKYSRTHCFWTGHVPNKFNKANVTLRIRGECDTHRNCSQMFHTCFQRNIASWRAGDFREG